VARDLEASPSLHYAGPRKEDQDCRLSCGPGILGAVAANLSTAELCQRLAHVRWIGGGTGTGKSTLTTLLAARFGLDVYDGDQGERDYIPRMRPDKQPRMAALLAMTPTQRWLDRSAAQIIGEMPSLHGETFPFVLDDLLARPAAKLVLVDDFRTLPREVAPLLTWPGQAIFLVATLAFRQQALRDRYADPARARANWGDADPQPFITARLARDELWDAEVRRQAQDAGLPVLWVDGTRSAIGLASELAHRFRLAPAPDLT
jgi:hypothetical protein